MTSTLSQPPALPDIPSPGSIVKVRGREWVTLPQSRVEKQDQVLRLRPLGGGDQTIATLFWPLEGEQVQPASFALPDPALSGSQSSALLLRDALLLKLRAGAGPFRCLGNVALEPRPYQLVPLLMALKQEVSRVLIADEVGLGKTVEALLIARELLDRGEIRKVTVICPPHLCEKWKSDMIRQFNLAAEVVRPGTAQKLERGLPAGKSIFDVVPFTVVSLDWIKSDRNREGFLRSCGEFVIVDEAHTCAARKGGGRQQRYELLRGLAADPQRHLVLLTATPHSGDKEAFDNLLGLLDPKFEGLSEMPEGQRRKDLRDELGNYFVQRRRLDLKEEWGTEGADFPDRETREATYTLSGDWGRLFDDVLAYARELVERSVGESKLRQRMSWWAALALLRCVSSSPAAASASLRTKLFNLQSGADPAAAPSDDELADDLEAMATLAVLDGAEEEFSAEEAAPGADLADSADAGLLKDLIGRSDRLRGKAHDPKLKQLLKELKALLAEGFRPVIFCRFRPTAHYLAEQLEEELPKRAHVVMAVTGDLPPEERVERIRELQNELANGKVPVLVATDCLSEGIDLQHIFDAVIHYDLCWNPTRHEQREGRVDRFGQARSAVRALMLHGGDSNPVDERVRTVILEKEKTIRKELGVSVPIPGNANTITQAVLGGIFGKAAKAIQGFLNLGLPGFGGSGSDLDAVIDAEWQSAKENAKATRTIFAQRSLKPEEALREWNRTRESLGSADAVERLVLNACRRLNLPIGPLPSGGGWELDLTRLEDNRQALNERLRNHDLGGKLRLSFRSPARDGSQLLSRSHPLVVELADFVAERALSGLEPDLAARASVIRTKAVAKRTQVLVLRLRHQLHQSRWTGSQYEALPDLLVEECLTARVNGDGLEPLEGAAALELLEAPASGNIDPGQRQQWLQEAVAEIDALQPALAALAERRADLAEEDHRRVREASLRTGESLRMRFRCEPSLPVDVIGVFVLLPAPTL
ncbi:MULTISPECIES: helicase-related protein [Synechococcaceae]|uniref:helicase-related protein n=1 Tax=Synechococcaceae TaxID=1890426 RepID=UPI000B97EB88|nr:helicase-related protein [Vulcanococcus limneticus]MCP9793275.1 DEAD/DEAH box helicase [Vulcanococcus limneticus MW73D5]MCP9895308.1 DEAD/DEAH box helicase [Vulcanococcus limneticus Candia 3F8]MCP9898701.1 DEAD/DEAH box helicase [Vulcanococcus limneticus Candia 3B3]